MGSDPCLVHKTGSHIQIYLQGFHYISPIFIWHLESGERNLILFNQQNVVVTCCNLLNPSSSIIMAVRQTLSESPLTNTQITHTRGPCGCVAERPCCGGRRWGTLSAAARGGGSRKLRTATVHYNTASSSSDPRRQTAAVVQCLQWDFSHIHTHRPSSSVEVKWSEGYPPPSAPYNIKKTFVIYETLSICYIFHKKA